MASLEELRTVRLEKLKMIQTYGMDPYPAKVTKDFTLAEVLENFKNLEDGKKEISLVGRIMSIRGQGAIIFASIFDGTAKFQAVFKKDELEENLFKLFTN